MFKKKKNGKKKSLKRKKTILGLKEMNYLCKLFFIRNYLFLFLFFYYSIFL